MVAEDLDHPNMAVIEYMFHIVFGILNVMWIGIWIHHQSATPVTFVGPESFGKSAGILDNGWAWIMLLLCRNWDCWTTLNDCHIYNVFAILYVMWTEIWIPISTLLHSHMLAAAVTATADWEFLALYTHLEWVEFQIRQMVRNQLWTWSQLKHQRTYFKWNSFL